MTVGGLAPPDGGWGWAVVLAGFVQAALVFGVLRSFGVFFVAFVVHFGEPAGAVSWVPAIAVAVQQFASPVGSILSAWLGPRPIVMAGGILASLGLILASFATSLIQLYLTIGLLTGWLRDVTGDYRASFVVAGAFLLAGTLVLTTLPDFFCTAATSSGHSATPRTAPGLHKDPCCAGRSYLPPGEDPE